jgi:hypothetical protein|tara:strand:- start:3458 stop:4042 length:585 start_codon:yes stop_codon:yes gene_type:complete
MSLLSCYTRLNIVNCTGLPAKITIKSNDNLFMRIQPVDEANIEAEIATNADSVSEWVQEWFNLLRYGPTYDSFQWLLEGQTTESARLQLLSSLSISINWGDQSVNWQSQVDGIWTVDISKITEVTIYLKSDIGEYQKKHTKNGPATVSSVRLKPYLEIACDESVPFSLERQPIASIYYSKSINLQNIINPTKKI